MNLNLPSKIGARPSSRFSVNSPTERANSPDPRTPESTSFPNRISYIVYRKSRAVALVITLLMLSVITFLAVAFLAVTRRDREATASSLDQGDAHTMQDVALARAQSEIIAHMQARGDTLSYELLSSHNFINPYGLTNEPGVIDTNNVNYDFLAGSPGTPLTQDQKVQTIANLLYDPRPPVFVRTNRNGSNDFRFWIDLNRNGLFETNGYQAVIGSDGVPLAPDGTDTATAPFLTNYFDGEPEWIGLLRNPEIPHSAQNRFIGRYAYLVLPVGKTLDINYIHNHAKQGLAVNKDGYLRNQGVGSWELNLAAYLTELNNNAWNNPISGLYSYDTNFSPTVSSGGAAFSNALEILANRYTNNLSSLASAQTFFRGANPVFKGGNIDAYDAGPLFLSATTNFNTVADTLPWVGSDNPYSYYNFLDELFDTTRTPGFSARLQNVVNAAGFFPSSYNRYTFQRLLATLGTDSTPDLQVQVHGDLFTNNAAAVQGNFITRTKVNINYTNLTEIKNNLNSSPTNLGRWTPSAFFTNAADLLLRSQIFTITNQFVTNGPVFTNYATFGATNIPIFNSTNNGVRYDERIHRMLQIAANIYDATSASNETTQISYPSVFRPQFKQIISSGAAGNVTNTYITNWVSVGTFNDLSTLPWKGITEPISAGEDCMIWGVPLVIGVKKGLPNFNEYSYTTSLGITRKLNFIRPNTNAPPTITNQFYNFSISNQFGVELWNSYGVNFADTALCYVTNQVSILLTNDAPAPNSFGTNFFLTNTAFVPLTSIPRWDSKTGANNPAFILPLITNVIPLPQSYYSETKKGFILTNTPYLPGDLKQTAWPTYGWKLHVTNRLMFALVDIKNSPGTPKILDFVNLADFGSTIDVTQELTHVNGAIQVQPSYTTLLFDPARSDSTPSSAMSVGMSNQIAIGRGDFSIGAWVTGDTNYPAEISRFRANMNPTAYPSDNTSATSFDDPLQPTARIEDIRTWQANDPLVHYTLGDLTSAKTTNNLNIITPVSTVVPPSSNLGRVNTRLEAWPNPNIQGDSQIVGGNMTFKDPQIMKPDNWNFPTNLFPGIGWLGRVHRGTPWQTIFLKNDVSPNAANMQQWTNFWVNTIDTYPTTDYHLLDLFTTTPNDNASRGLLSVNQTNLAAWSALLSGTIILSNNTKSAAIDPSSVAALVQDPVNGINAVRATNSPARLFHSVGEILAAPALTTLSPFLGGSADASSAYRDDVVERIPQQILSLLKVGQPRFVIYAYGQSLKPKDIVLTPPDPKYFNLCTNYAITGEFVTRTVCHVEGDAIHPKIVVDNFNVLNGN